MAKDFEALTYETSREKDLQIKLLKAKLEEAEKELSAK